MLIGHAVDDVDASLMEAGLDSLGALEMLHSFSRLPFEGQTGWCVILRSSFRSSFRGSHATTRLKISHGW